MTASELAPYLGFVGVFIAAVVAYAFNMRLERHKSFQLQERAKAYVAFIDAVGAISLEQREIAEIKRELRDADPADRPGILDALYGHASRHAEKSGELASAKVRIAIFGSEEVVERLVDFWRNGAVLDTPENQGRFTRITLVMRKETVGIGRLKADHFETLLFGG